jgi:thioredoxin
MFQQRLTRLVPRIKAVHRVGRSLCFSPISVRRYVCSPSFRVMIQRNCFSTNAFVQMREKEAQKDQSAGKNDLIVSLSRENYKQELSNNNQILVLDFYADWCGPCQQFTPILEKVVKKRNGLFKLLKVNTDLEQEIASTFKVTALPSMFIIFRKKAITQKIEGAMGEADVEQLFDQVEEVLSEELQDVSQKEGEYTPMDESETPRTPEQKLEIAKQLIAMDQIPKAESLLAKILTEDAPKMDNNEKTKIVPSVLSSFAMCYLLNGDMQQSEEMIERIRKEFPHATENNQEVKSTVSLHELYAKAGEEMRALAASLRPQIEQSMKLGNQFDFDQVDYVSQLKKRIQDNPKDYEAYYKLSLFYFLNGLTRESLEQAMNIARRNIKWNDFAAKKLILNYTNIMADKKEAEAARRKLATYLYV